MKNLVVTLLAASLLGGCSMSAEECRERRATLSMVAAICSMGPVDQECLNLVKEKRKKLERVCD